MFNVALDKDNFFTGNYAKVGTVENGVFVNELPPSENQLCYYLTDKEIIRTKELPEKLYIKYVDSETETTTIYRGKDGLQLAITDEEYTDMTNEEKADIIVETVPTIVSVEITEEEYNSLSEDEKLFIMVCNKTDEEGNIIYKTVEYAESVKEWVFSEEKYKIFINEKEQKEAEELAKREAEEKAKQEKAEEIANIKSELERQKEFSSSVLFTLDNLLTEVIPSLMEGSEAE